MKKKPLLVALFMLLSGLAFASDEVSIVVSSDGATKDEAIKMALRSAIEQTFGAFVSSNTTILNDQLVNDEIVSLSNGNVKSYEILTENTLPNNRYYVTLRVTICMNKLVNYINTNSKSTTVEVNMDAFDKNIRLAEMNKNAEKHVLDQVLEQIRTMDNLFDFELQLGEPTLTDEAVYWDKNKGLHGGVATKDGEFCCLIGKVVIRYNRNTDIAIDLLANAINHVKMSKEEIKQYEKMGINYIKIDNKNRGIGTSSKMETLDLNPFQKGRFGCAFPTEELICLRNGGGLQSSYPELIAPFGGINNNMSFNSVLFVERFEFEVGDNISTPTQSIVSISDVQTRYRVGYSVYCKGRNKRFNIGDVVAECDIKIYIPKERASSYKSFSVYPKQMIKQSK